MPGVSWDSSDVFRMTRGDGRRITLDLGHISAVERVEFDMLILTAWGVYPVGEVGVLVSENGTDWQSVATVWVDYGDATSEMLSFTADLGGVRRARDCVPADADQGALRYERDQRFTVSRHGAQTPHCPSYSERSSEDAPSRPLISIPRIFGGIGNILLDADLPR